MYIFGVGDCHRLSPGVTVVLIAYRGSVSAVSDDMCGRFCPMRKSEHIYMYTNVLYMWKTHIRKARWISGKGTRAGQS